MKQEFLAVTAGNSAACAAKVMAENSLEWLPVVNGAEIIGVVTRHELENCEVAGREDDNALVGLYVSQETPRWCMAHDPVRKAREIMESERTDRLLVMDGGGRMAGALSTEMLD